MDFKNAPKIKSVAVIGAGASGAITASALQAEGYFERIRVFERRETPGGTWIHDPDPGATHPLLPGKLPPESDPALEIPAGLPRTTEHNRRERWEVTPIYSSLTTNVPDIAMCFSDSPFAYGPFVPHHIPRQYIENYFATHKTDSFLELNTTLEDLSRVPSPQAGAADRWKLTLRRYDPARHLDTWWEELFDAVVLANGHYSVPYIPHVEGLEEYNKRFPGRVVHSKYYRTPLAYTSQRVVVIGNSASGHDVSTDLLTAAELPVIVSRRSASRWDGDTPPAGIAWKPVVRNFLPSGRIVFDDGSHLDDVDAVVYCTGYKVSFPFWNEAANGRPLWDYDSEHLVGGYWHSFFRDFPTLGIVGLPRTLTFRSFEYQAIALARLWAGRNAIPLPDAEEQERWETERVDRTRAERKKFHDIPWDDGETAGYLNFLFRLAGLGTLKGEGRIPPVLGKALIWAIENIHKYPEPPKKTSATTLLGEREDEEGGWVVIGKERPDSVLI